MSGIEIAGLVLGAFPIILNCLDYYQRGFEPLEEWWNFCVHFIAFIDDIRHQMMKYHGTLSRLLDPIIADHERLSRLLADPSDAFWRDKTFEVHLQGRLSTETDRFFRILGRMQSLMGDLNSLLQIKDSHFRWVGTVDQRPWQWHFQRIRISFSKGKHRKVKKLASHNQELEDILAYSDHVIPISNRRQASEPVARLEKIRQHVHCVHQALARRWTCSQTCRRHEARLQVNAKANTVVAHVMLVTADGELKEVTEKIHDISIKPSDTPSVVSPTNINFIEASSTLIEVQHTVSEQEARANNEPSVTERLKIQSKRALFKTRPGSPSTKTVTFQGASDSSTKNIPTPRRTQPASISGLVPITYFCSFLKDTGSIEGLICDEFDRHLLVYKARSYYQSSSTVLMSLHDVLNAYSSKNLSITRKLRFEMATHIASALLQTHLSPWLAARWSKHDFYFLVDTKSQSLCGSSPFVVQLFPGPASDGSSAPGVGNDGGVPDTKAGASREKSGSTDEESRAILRSVGVMLLELIFGDNIEDCPFREL